MPHGQHAKKKSDHRGRARARNSTSTQSVSSPVSESTSSSLDIPGFYYDTEKKRYFKISLHMRESLLAKQAEQLRQKDLLLETEMPAAMAPNSNIEALIRQRSAGCLAPPTFRSSVGRIMAGALRRARGDRMDVDADVEHIEQLIVAPEAVDDSDSLPTIVALGRLKRMCMSSAYTLQVCCKNSTGKYTGFIPILDIMEKLTRCVRAMRDTDCVSFDAASGASTCLYVAYTTLPGLHDGRSHAHIRRLLLPRGSSSQNQHSAFASSQTVRTFDLGPECAWTMACSPTSRRLAVGIETCAQVYDYDTNVPIATVNSHNSSVFALDFCPKNESLLFCGTKRGEVICHDLRAPRSAYSWTLWPEWQPCRRERDGVCHVVPLKSTSHIIVADTSGEIGSWDVRIKKVVCRYVGLGNNYKHIPFHVDESETYLCSAGADGYVRIWQVSNGWSLMKIIPPAPTELSRIPAVSLFTGSTGCPRLLLGLDNHVYTYTFRGDTCLPSHPQMTS